MTFSIIIPTCGRPALLRHCLEALSRQLERCPGAEVIVTSDGTEIPVGIKSEFPFVTWADGPRRGPAANRNHGARAATGTHLLFTDDDCLPDCRWIVEMLRAFAAGASVVEGKTICPNGTDSPFEERVENLAGGVLWSCNMGIERELFWRLGGFDEDFTEPAGEDMEFAARLRRAGVAPVFAWNAVVLHPVRKIGFRQLYRRLLMLRWLLLYRHKTGTASSRPAWLDVPAFFAADALRNFWRFFHNFTPRGWRTRLFTIVLRATALPFLLPYLVRSEVRFREQVLPPQRTAVSSAPQFRSP